MNDSLSKDFPDSVKNTGLIIGIIFAPIQTLIAILIFCLILYYLGRLLLKFNSFKVIISLLGYAYLPLVLKTSLLALLNINNEQLLIPQGISSLINTNNQLIKLVAGNLDIFIVWNLFLSLIALSVAYKISNRLAAFVIFGFWAVSIVVQYFFQ